MTATDTFLNNVLENLPSDWLRLTTHRLDIYNEELAKVEFLEKFEALSSANPSDLKNGLASLPTAFDYIRLGHPLSCVLEWSLAKSLRINVDNIVSFSSMIMPVMAILRKNLLNNVKTQIVYKEDLPKCFDVEALKSVYNYNFEVVQSTDIPGFEGTTVYIHTGSSPIELNDNIDFVIHLYPEMGSIVLANGSDKESYISEILHVRRRESIAMTPNDCFAVLNNENAVKLDSDKKQFTLETIKKITNSNNDALLGNCGLSMQYTITMGLIEDALVNHKGKDIKLIVPPNCYGGTNDQARRVAACVENVEIMDLPVDSGQDMVLSVEKVLTEVAKLDAVALIIAEIPTNP